MTKKVKLYTTPYCTYCRLVKAFLRKHNIDFEEVDVSEDPVALREVVEKSGQMGVPVVEINSKIIVGFNEPEIRKALGLK